MRDPRYARRYDESEEERVKMRDEDLKFWWRAARLVEKYSPAILGGLLVYLGWLGFALRTPTQRIEEVAAVQRNDNATLSARLDSLRHDQDSLKRTHQQLERDMNIVVRSFCLSGILSDREKRLAGVFDANGQCIHP